jgi:hypothetical protein
MDAIDKREGTIDLDFLVIKAGLAAALIFLRLGGPVILPILDLLGEMLKLFFLPIVKP